jgi:hypothetical protein
MGSPLQPSAPASHLTRDSSGVAVHPGGPGLRPLLVPTVLGIGLTVLLLVLLVGAGRLLDREPVIPWVCDDTRFVDTVPTGRGVVGPAVSAPPGCGGQGG